MKWYVFFTCFALFLVFLIPVFADKIPEGFEWDGSQAINQTLTPNLTLTPTLTPTAVITPISTVLPTEEPTGITSEPTPPPTIVQTPEPTVTTSEPTLPPTIVQTPEPTVTTSEPTLPPTIVQTPEPTVTTSEPTLLPIIVQTTGPTVESTSIPSPEPTINLTPVQTGGPITEPTSEITPEPIILPIEAQSEEPVPLVTSEPTEVPTVLPAVEPLAEPTVIAADAPGYLEINSDPERADVYFDTIYRGPSPVIVIVPTTSSTPHTVTMQLSGYQELTSEIASNPPSGTTVVVNMTLVPLPPNGSVSVTSSPTGSMVVLDGADLHTTPYTYDQVTPGVHTVGISKDGYLSYETSVTVTSGAEATVFAALSPVSSSGSLTVLSSPSDALILLNNIAYGVTPAHFNAIAVGTYNVKLVKSGYQPVSTTVEIKPGVDSSVSTYLPRRIPMTGTLTIRSEPSGGTVILDGEVQGVTPLRVSHLVPGSYNLRVSIPGYLSYIEIIHINAGRETSIYAPIGPMRPVSYLGSLSVQSDPSGASVTVDSRSLGKSPLFIQNVAAGTHTIHLEYPGYLPYTTTAQVWPEQTRYVSSILTKQPVINRSADLITLSDDAATFFKAHGRTEALNAYNSPYSGFTRDGMYVIGLDLNGTIIADGGNSTLIGVNLSQQADAGGILSGTLITTLASMGGGLIYDTSLSGKDPAQVSLVYIRPAISGVVIGTVIQVPDITSPDPFLDTQGLQEVVHAAVMHSRIYDWRTLDTSDEYMRTLIQPGMSLYPFELNVSEDADIYGVRQSQILSTAAANDGGYFWILNREEPDIISLIPGYAEAVDTSWGIWSLAKSDDENVIMMVDMNTIKI
ncbi:MAG TPA: PEGA domain-containing protein [Methanospirillum sp.]|nr:PEGA domain-containing protein [Methanospirillum sp.]